MPPKPKYTREQIVETALEIVAREGAEALTAKELAKGLHTSTTPIFTVFRSMQEVLDSVKDAAMACFEGYAHKTGGDMPLFKQVGMQMILFAREQPHLYRFIFMSRDQDALSFDGIFDHLGRVADECLEMIRRDYGLQPEAAKTLFEHVWIHTFGIGVLCATGMCSFSDGEISQMMTQDFTAMMMLLKSENEG